MKVADGAPEADTGGDPVTTPIVLVAVVVFDRPRHVNGRQLAFTRPQPKARLALAR